MKLQNVMKTTFLAAAAVLAISPMASVSAATTQDVQAEIGIKAGVLSIDGFVPTAVLPNIELDGYTKVSKTSDLAGFNLTDATGSGDGYHITVASTQMTEVGGIGLVLPQGSIGLENVASVTANGTTSPAPTIQAWGGPAMIDNGSSHVLMVADLNEGMGVYNALFPADALQLTVNPDTKVTDATNQVGGVTPFSSTVTFSIVTGP